MAYNSWTAARTIKGRTTAIFLAGPLFLLFVWLGVVAVSGEPLPLRIGLRDLTTVAFAVPMLALVSATGAVLAVAPVLLGSAAMRLLASLNIAFQLRVMWALVGCGMAAVPALFLGAEPFLLFALTMTGGAVAAVASGDCADH